MARPVKSELGPFPFGDKCSLGFQCQHAMITRVCNVDVPDPIDGDPVRLAYFFLRTPFCCYDGQKRAGRRERFDAAMTGMRPRNSSPSNDSISSRRIKFP